MHLIIIQFNQGKSCFISLVRCRSLVVNPSVPGLLQPNNTPEYCRSTYPSRDFNVGSKQPVTRLCVVCQLDCRLTPSRISVGVFPRTPFLETRNHKNCGIFPARRFCLNGVLFFGALPRCLSSPSHRRDSSAQTMCKGNDAVTAEVNGQYHAWQGHIALNRQ